MKIFESIIKYLRVLFYIMIFINIFGKGRDPIFTVNLGKYFSFKLGNVKICIYNFLRCFLKIVLGEKGKLLIRKEINSAIIREINVASNSRRFNAKL